jgi:hypothetical protein
MKTLTPLPVEVKVEVSPARTELDLSRILDGSIWIAISRSTVVSWGKLYVEINPRHNETLKVSARPDRRNL